MRVVCYDKILSTKTTGKFKPVLATEIRLAFDKSHPSRSILNAKKSEATREV